MKKIITLKQYFEMGGDISKLNLSRTYVNDGTKYGEIEIVKIEDHNINKEFIDIKFLSGKIKSFDKNFVTTEIDVIIDPKYLK